MYTHQVAALFCVKRRHGRHLESVTSNRKSDSVNRYPTVFTWRTILPNFTSILVSSLPSLSLFWKVVPTRTITAYKISSWSKMSVKVKSADRNEPRLTQWQPRVFHDPTVLSVSDKYINVNKTWWRDKQHYYTKKSHQQAGRRQVRSLLPVCHIDVFMFSCIGLPIRLYLSHYI